MNLSEEYEAELFGSINSDTFRVFFKKKLPNIVDQATAKVHISPFHDIPLYSEKGSNFYRMIVRMPRWTNAKMEVSKTEPFNPIKHTCRKQSLKFVENVFPFHGVIWNYGSFPQTWEMQSYQNPDFEGYKGDNNLMDVIEIGTRIHPIGAILDVKVLGAILLLDHDHLDWKIIAIDINDPLADKIEDIFDINGYMPGLLDSTVEWFQFYKIPSGEAPLNFGYKNKFVDKMLAYETIEKAHKFWTNLIKNELYFKDSKDCAGFSLINTQCLECNDQHLKNNLQAEAIIHDLKQLVMNRPIESIAQAPPIDQIEKIFYLDKPDLLAKLSPLKTQETQEEEQGRRNLELMNSNEGLLNYFLKRFSYIALPVGVCAVVAPLIYLRLASKD